MALNFKHATLLTPVRDRALTFANCERLMFRAMQYCIKQGMKDITFDWVVVDDGKEKVTCTMGQEHIKLAASNKSPLESFKQNLLIGMQEAQGDVICIIEDDDWKSERYLFRMLKPFLLCNITNQEINELVGLAPATYYNPVLRVGQWLGNREHASLSETVIGGFDLQDKFCSVIQSAQSFDIDLSLWRATQEEKRHLLDNTGAKDALGIKGLVPHALAEGHNEALYKRSPGATWADPSGTKLKQMIGDEDADIYFELARKLSKQTSTTEEKEAA